MSKPSGWLQAVCIVAIILGVLGLMSGLWGVAGLAMGPGLQKNLTQSQGFGATPKQHELQQEMLQEVQKIADRWQPVTIPLLAANIIVSIGMIFGAIQTLRMRPSGRGFLVGVFFVAIIFIMFQTVLNVVIQNETVAVTSDFMSKMVNASVPEGQTMPAGAEAVAKGVAKAAVIVGLVFGIGMKLAELAFYIFGFIYLGRPNVKERFVEPADAQLV